MHLCTRFLDRKTAAFNPFLPLLILPKLLTCAASLLRQPDGATNPRRLATTLQIAIFSFYRTGQQHGPLSFLVPTGMFQPSFTF
jgi:hypothetical protein